MGQLGPALEGRLGEVLEGRLGPGLVGRLGAALDTLEDARECALDDLQLLKPFKPFRDL